MYVWKRYLCFTLDNSIGFMYRTLFLRRELIFLQSICRVWQKNWAKKVLVLKQFFQTPTLSLKVVKLKICIKKGSVKASIFLNFPHSLSKRTAFWHCADYRYREIAASWTLYQDAWIQIHHCTIPLPMLTMALAQ